MQLREFYTVLCTDDVAGTAAFWEKHFGFRRAFEAFAAKAKPVFEGN